MYLVVSPVDISFTILGIFNGKNLIKEEKIVSAPEEILATLSSFVSSNDLKWDDVEGIIVETGPGSATALRAGIAIVNTIAFSKNIPLFEITGGKEVTLEDKVSMVDLKQGKKVLVPVYEHPAV